MLKAKYRAGGGAACVVRVPHLLLGRPFAQSGVCRLYSQTCHARLAPAGFLVLRSVCVSAVFAVATGLASRAGPIAAAAHQVRLPARGECGIQLDGHWGTIVCRACAHAFTPSV
jgi:hypothetical protein